MGGRKNTDGPAKTIVETVESRTLLRVGRRNAKVVGEVHFHGGAAAPTSPLPQEPDDPPIISFEESQNIFIGNSGWVWVEHHEGLPVLVAVFRNRIRGVGIPTPIAYRVSAHLTFKSPNTTVRVDHGAWVGEYTYYAEFKPNDVRKGAGPRSILIYLQTQS